MTTTTQDKHTELNFPDKSIKENAQDILQNLEQACPWSATFLFMEEGCGAVGQATPLAKSIESAMRRKFLLWQQTWIEPHARDIIAKLSQS